MELERAIPAAPAASKSAKPFANPDLLVRSWYLAARSRQVRRGRVRSFDFLDRRVALWRDGRGALHALDARCPHLGADLGKGRVIGERLRCDFHHWAFDASGRCVEAPALAEPPERSGVLFPVVERYGLIWIFHGPEPTFEIPGLPEGDDQRRFWILRPPRQHIGCHPHLVVGNGLDVSHFETLHGMRYTREPELRQVDDLRLSLTLRGAPRSKFFRLLTGTEASEVVATFTTVGANLAWLTVQSLVRLHVLFYAGPSPRGGTETQTVLFLPRRFGLSAVRSLILLYTLVRDDGRILGGLDFHPGFTAADEPLRRFAELVNRMEVA